MKDDILLGAGLGAVFSLVVLLLLPLLSGCGAPCGSFEVDINTTTEDGVTVDEACYEVTDDGAYDLEGCCPAGYEAAGFNADGTGVVCLGRCS